MKSTKLELNAVLITAMAAGLAALLIFTGHAEAGSAIAGGVVGGVAKQFAGMRE